MGKYIFDFEDGEFIFSASDNMPMDTDGHLMMRVGDNMVIEMASGELHIVSG